MYQKVSTEIHSTTDTHPIQLDLWSYDFTIKPEVEGIILNLHSHINIGFTMKWLEIDALSGLDEEFNLIKIFFFSLFSDSWPLLKLQAHI